MNRTTFRVGCELNYQLTGPGAFIFNVGVVTNSFQRVLNEQFVTAPIYQIEESVLALEEKRHHRFSRRQGRFRFLTRRQSSWPTASKKGIMFRKQYLLEYHQKSFRTFIQADTASRICSSDWRNMSLANCNAASPE